MYGLFGMKLKTRRVMIRQLAYLCAVAASSSRPGFSTY